MTAPAGQRWASRLRLAAAFERLRSRFDRDVTQTIATQGLLLASPLIVSVVTARFLGPAGRGSFFLMTTVAALVAQFGNLGLVSTNTFVVAKRRELLGALTTNALALSLAVTVTTALMVRLVGDRFLPGAGLLYFAAVIGGGRLFHLLAVNLLAGTQRFRSFNAFQIVAGALLVVAISLAAVKPSVEAFLWAVLVAALITGLLLAIHIHRLSPLPGKPDLSLYSPHLRYSLKSYCILTIGFLMLRGNVFLIERLSSLTELGFYSVAVQIAEAIGVLAGSVGIVLFPRLVARAANRFRYMLGYLLAVTATLVLVCSLAAVLARPAVSLAFGPEFLPAVVPTLWLMPGVLFVGMHSVVAQYLAAEGQPAVILVSWLLAVAVMAGLGAFLIPAGGAASAAISLSAGYFVLLLANSGVAAVTARRNRRLDRPSDTGYSVA